MTRRRRVVLSLALGIGLLAMHHLVLLMTPTGAMPVVAGPMAVAHASSATRAASSATSAASRSDRLTMGGCARHACVAARGAVTTSPMAPGVACVLAAPTWTVPRPPSANLLGSQRPPPRSGPRSPLCVWRV